ncbi:putative Myosin light chain kinase, smooth muscle [Blattamonas nauphoetae]|uniref:Myosin light chain kinase, smooth muscle n=1 Tax=Blattamonas nauphoetae TaxID=2049346 RepID=A0ABQ9X7C0_9EUKA|nr:putative Myosin light chain kinase, smooth muscle [Blattamonas nauphoetae]
MISDFLYLRNILFYYSDSKPKKISSGAFGQVLKVTHERSGVKYAVKVLPMLKEGDKERVSREVEMLTRFAHARIVHLHESIDMGGHHAIVMELGTRNICEGLLWMHTHPSGSTAHGDLKPENVLLRENNRAFLCDLGGSAAFEQHMTQTTGEFGTFEYNSPERVMDSKGTGTAASDVWSLGVVAYRMVTGRGLFEGLTLPQLFRSLSHFSESNIPPSIPASNLGLRVTTSALLEGGLLEGMLGSSTDLSRMKSIQLATLVNEIKESLNDAEVEERTMELSIEKEKLLLETQGLERRFRMLQKSLERTRSRIVELEKEEDHERCQQLLATPPSPISISSEDNVLSTKHEMPAFTFFKVPWNNFDEQLCFEISGNTITRTDVDNFHSSTTMLFEEPVSKGVVSVAFTVLTIPPANYSREGLMFLTKPSAPTP